MRYFFHIRDRHGVVPDEEGTELPNMDCARQEARDSAKDFIADDLRGGPSAIGRQIEITDASGHVLEAMPLIGVLLPAQPH